MLKAQKLPNTKTLDEWTSDLQNHHLSSPVYVPRRSSSQCLQGPVHLGVAWDAVWDATLTPVGSHSFPGYPAARDASGVTLGPREQAQWPGPPYLEMEYPGIPGAEALVLGDDSSQRSFVKCQGGNGGQQPTVTCRMEAIHHTFCCLQQTGNVHARRCGAL